MDRNTHSTPVLAPTQAPPAPSLPALAAQCATAAAALLTGPTVANTDIRFLAQGYLRMAAELVECSGLAAPYLWHVQVTCWAGIDHWRRWLCSDDLTDAQDAEYTALAAAWATLLAAWEAAQESEPEAAA